MLSTVVAKRIIKQILKDRRTLALLFVAPLMIIFLLSSVINSTVDKPNLTAVGLPSELVTQLKKHANVTSSSDYSASIRALEDRRTDAVLTGSGSKYTIHVEGSEASVTGAVKKAVASAMADYTKTINQASISSSVQSIVQKAAAQGYEAGFKQAVSMLSPQKPFHTQSAPSLKDPAFSSALETDISAIHFQTMDNRYVYLNGSDDMTAFDAIAPMLMGFFIFFFVFLLAGISFLRERISGTLDRLLATPVKRSEVVFGYFYGFGLFAVLQTVVIQIFMVSVLKIPIKGSFLLVLLVNILLAAGSLSLGTLLSAFARSEFQLFQFIPIVIVPQILFCGLFTLRGAPEWVTILSKIFPLTYGADALMNVALRGKGMSSIWVDLLVLAGYMAVFLILNSLVLKKYRRL